MDLVYKAEMLGRLLEVMEERFGDIRIGPLYPRAGAAANRVLGQAMSVATAAQLPPAARSVS